MASRSAIARMIASLEAAPEEARLSAALDDALARELACAHDFDCAIAEVEAEVEVKVGDDVGDDVEVEPKGDDRSRGDPSCAFLPGPNRA